MTRKREGVSPFRRFRLMAVRYALAATVVLAVLAYLWDPVAARGVLLGSFAGILGFWIIAVRLERLAIINPEGVKFSVLTWSMLRFALYGLVLYRAYTLDMETYHGLLGALGGILIIRFVLMFLGFTGADLARGNAAKPGEHG